MIQGLKRLVVPKTADQALHPYFLHKERTRYSPAVGGARNDQIDGGDGDDMIGGGAGNDYISRSSALVVPQRLRPTGSWSPLGGEEVKVSSATWGVYIGEEASGDKVTIWQDIGSVPGSSEGDSVDGGAGKDDIIASWGNDRVPGGEGDDRIDGLAGDDVLEGSDGADGISADGITKEGYLNSVAATSHGADFADGGAIYLRADRACYSGLRSDLNVEIGASRVKTGVDHDLCPSFKSKFEILSATQGAQQ